MVIILEKNQKRSLMRKIILSGITICAPLLSLIADGAPAPVAYVPPKSEDLKISENGIPLHEHRVNFGFVNVGYERIKSDSIYTGVETKLTTVWNTTGTKSKPLDHFINWEVRLGYNHSVSDSDFFVPYLGTGFSMYSVQKLDGNVKSWSYGTAGLKYFHQFGPIFEMGIHLKGYLSINQRRSVLKTKEFETPKESPVSAGIEGDVPEFDNPETEVKLVTKTVKDTRWISEIGVPFIWHIGDQKNWEIQFEPYYLQIPNAKITHLIGSKLTCGYRF
jgi:hypothetical protein